MVNAPEVTWSDEDDGPPLRLHYALLATHPTLGVLVLVFTAIINTNSITDIEFRLKQFDDQANDGIAQISYNGTWGAIDIPNRGTYSDFTAKALCNSIGLGYEGFATYNINRNESSEFLLTWTSDFACTTNHSFAIDCLNVTLLTLSNNTVLSILHCYPFEVTDIRLTGGAIPSEGLLEARISNRWGAVRYPKRYNWKDEFDDMICRTLGYVEESVIQPIRHGPAYAIITLRPTQCSNLTSIYNITRQCPTEKGWSGSDLFYQYREINCKPIRLMDGPSALEGRVEAGLFGQLRSICGLGFDELAANVTCTSLGFSGILSFELKTVYGAGNLSIYSRQISCSGQELSLEHCNHSNTDIKECGEDDVVSVSCIGGPMKLERFNESKPHEGLLTAYHGGEWYYVSTGVSDVTARTLCSMLGFGSVGFPALSHFSRNIYYYKSDISCYGNESYIDECSGDLQYCVTQEYYYCSVLSWRSGLLALFCSDYAIQRITLVNSKIVLTINNETWSVCVIDFSNEAAASACRILGHAGLTSVWTVPVESGDNPNLGALICDTGATMVTECKLQHQYTYLHIYPGNTCSEKMAITCTNECRQGYFGSNCTACLCKPVNSLSCHTVTGACTCKQGWSGPTCSDDVNECEAATDICKDPSVCVNTAGAYFCQCPDGMYMKDTVNGGTCKVCSNNTFGINCLSTCSCRPMTTYNSDQICEPATGQCFCKPEWTGVSCDTDVNECAMSANALCQKNNTECINNEGGYVCDCIDGFKHENGTCVPISFLLNAAEKSNMSIIVIASAVGGSVGIIVVIAVVVWCVRRHKGKRDRQTPASQEQQSGRVYTDGINNDVLSESGKYDVVGEVRHTNGAYPDIQNDHQASHEYLELSSSLNDTYDTLDDEKMQNIKSEDMVSDGYLNPTNDDKYVSDGYLKPTKQGNNITGDYLKPERTNDRTHEYLKIKKELSREPRI